MLQGWADEPLSKMLDWTDEWMDGWMGDTPQTVMTNRAPLHNVHFGKYVYLPTEQAETYLKRCVLINYSTYICLCLFGWKVNMINEETVTFKL